MQPMMPLIVFGQSNETAVVGTDNVIPACLGCKGKFAVSVTAFAVQVEIGIQGVKILILPGTGDIVIAASVSSTS